MKPAANRRTQSKALTAQTTAPQVERATQEPASDEVARRRSTKPSPNWLIAHMALFGTGGFTLSYGADNSQVALHYVLGGIAITIYLVFYLWIFGRDEVKWMFINAALGVYGITGEMDLLLSLYGKSLSSYPLHLHVIPFLYYVMYTFLLRQLVLDWTGARRDARRRKRVEQGYVLISLAVYTAIYLL